VHFQRQKEQAILAEDVHFFTTYVQGIEHLCYEDLIEVAKKSFSKENQHRLAILIEGSQHVFSADQELEKISYRSISKSFFSMDREFFKMDSRY